MEGGLKWLSMILPSKEAACKGGREPLISLFN